MLGIGNKPTVIAVDDIHKHLAIIAIVIAQILVNKPKAKFPEYNSDSTPTALDRYKMEQELFFGFVTFKVYCHMSILRGFFLIRKPHIQRFRHSTIRQNDNIARQKHTYFLIAQERLHFVELRLQAVDRIVFPVTQRIGNELQCSAIMQVIHNKFIRRDFGIFAQPIKAAILHNLQNFLTGNKKQQSRNSDKNYGKNKVISTHHLFIMDSINIFQHSVITF